MGRIIDLIERNIHGGYTVYGAIGVRQYYEYTKAEAQQRYTEEARERTLHNMSYTTKGAAYEKGL